MVLLVKRVVTFGQEGNDQEMWWGGGWSGMWVVLFFHLGAGYSCVHFVKIHQTIYLWIVNFYA